MHPLLLKNRFELFIAIQVLILFGSLVFPVDFFETWILPVLFLLNIMAGMVLLPKKRLLGRFFLFLFVVAAISMGVSAAYPTQGVDGPNLVRLLAFFVFYLLVTYHIILQVWKAKKVDQKVIIGLMSGYISIGFLAFFLFLTIEILQPGSFKGELMAHATIGMQAEALMYYAYITLLTIGYGDIVPHTPVAQKASMLVGLVGQFYLVIITAIVVGKFLSQARWHERE